jgi:DNA repair exonuclease SbcCD ATPase subunit
MIDNEILDQALSKKNKEIEALRRQLDDTKKSYDMKVKNLMNSINGLKTENQTLSNSTKDNVRVNLIKQLKTENTDKEKVITLLRKMIDDDERVDTYLLKEFAKLGDQHIPTYEELKIKIRQLEAEIVSLKFNKRGGGKGKSDGGFEDSQAASKMKADILIYEDNIASLQNENTRLKENNEKLERLQTEMYDRLKKYNQEIGEMKSIYDTVKENLEEEHKLQLQETVDRADGAEKENIKLREKIRELIKIGEENAKQNIERIKKANAENDILKRLLESKKQEISIIVEELDKYKEHLDVKDGKVLMGQIKKERQRVELTENNKDYEEKVKFMDKLMKQKDYQLELMKKSLEDKDEMILEKDMEIDLINNKLQELEQIAIQNYIKNKK